MTIHKLQDLCYAYSVADPVREMLFALQDRIDALEAQKLQDRNAMDAMKLANEQWSVQCRQLESQLAVQTYAADNYRRLLDESDHAYAELKDGIDRWKTSYSNAMDVNADLRAKLAERSAEYLAAHITYDKGYQVGRQDAEDAKYDGADTWVFETAYAIEAKLKQKNNT